MQTITGTNWEAAAHWLQQGEVVAIPTETVYGLAGNALDADAVLKIFKAKNRPHFNPLIVHTHSIEAVQDFVKPLPDAAIRLAKHCWPGPLSLLLEKKDIIPDLVTAGFHKVAIRIPNHPLTLQLLKALPFPLAAPSANRFGYVSPTTAAHVADGLGGIIPYILDGGPCTVGVESTIVDFEDDAVIIRRKGGLGREAISRICGSKVQMRTHAHEHPVAPGQLKSHYATHTTLVPGNISELAENFKGKRIAVIEFGAPSGGEVYARFNLSAAGNADEAARNLFATMRRADACGADIIIAQILPEEGLGAAVNDRLKRASHR